MKKGRKYIEPMLGKGDKKGTNIKRRNEAAAEIKDMQTKDMKKGTPKVGVNGMTWDGISRPSTDEYRDNWNTIFRKEENAK